MHPKKQAEIPTSRDSVINRNNDIAFSDRTDREEIMLLMISDYVDLIRTLIKMAEDHGVKNDTINNLLNQQTNFHGQVLKPRRFLEILEGRFQIDELIRVERKNDEHTISNKNLISPPARLSFCLSRGIMMLMIN